MSHQFGVIRPVGLFRHGFQPVYSLTKGGVDASAQFHAALNYSGVPLTWEKNNMLYFFETLLMNSFVGWRMLEWEQYLKRLHSLGASTIPGKS